MIYKRDDLKIRENFKRGNVDSIEASIPKFSDKIIQRMYKDGIIDIIVKGFPEKREDNSSITLEAVLVLSLLAKLNLSHANTYITKATKNIEILEILGFNADIKNGNLISEGSIRALVGKYTAEELVDIFNNSMKKILEKKGYSESDIKKLEQLDATELEVNLKNKNYENSEVTIGKKGKTIRGYKLTAHRVMLPLGGLIRRLKVSRSE